MNFSLANFRKRRKAAFAWLNATQFFGALNDNVFKTLIQMFIIGVASATNAVPLAVATIVFALPYLFFTSYAGFLADRFSKKTVTVVLKYAELTIMVCAVPAFAFGQHWMLYVLLFLMSVQSALFSPTKYSIVPELVRRETLSRANSLLVAFSFLAIILGSALGPVLAKGMSSLFSVGESTSENIAYSVAQLACVMFAIGGIITSHQVRPLRSMKPDLHPDLLFPRKMWRTWSWVRTDKDLMAAMLANGLFSMLAAFLQINLVRYGMDHVKLDEKESSFLFFFAAIGIALGAWFSGRLSKRNIEFGTLPGGAFLLAFASYVLGFLPVEPNHIVLAACVLFAGIGAGLFIVPLDTFLQIRLPADRRGEGLALNSFLGWLGVLLSGVLLLSFYKLGVGAADGFMLFTIPALVLAFGSFFVLQDFAFRFVVTCVVKLLYRVRTIGVDYVPVEGPAMLVANHASYMDAVLLCATSRRRIRFLMSKEFYNKSRFLKKFFDLYGVIPVGVSSSPREVASAFREARRALDEGYLVCVFAEGGITRTGTVRGFKRGYEHILRGTEYPIIPVYMGGSWGTIYHYYRGQLVRNWWRLSLRRYKVTVLFGRPLPPSTSAYRVRQAVMELSCDYFNARKDVHHSLGAVCASRLRRSWGQDLANDTTGMRVTRGKALIAAVALARAIAPRVKDDDSIGILLPASCGGLIANISISLLGRAAVNLNFTTPKQAFHSSIDQCQLGTILTSRAVVERFPNLNVPQGKLVFVEDILRSLSLKTKIQCLFLAKFAPFSMITATHPTKSDDTALVLFSSGSTGEPKGVMLSQHNVLSMIESLQMLLATSPEDRICGVLPLFHSFGIMGTVWYPVLGNMKVSYHPNPLDAQIVVDLVRESACTMIFGTPTFLAVYLRKATKNDFKSLRFVLAGAEKLKESLIKSYVDKFGIRPYEAYGATELSPGIAVSVPHGTGGGITQLGYRDGRVGVPVPGIAMKITDPETGQELGPGEPGLLWLKGPNLMLGYLGRPDLTAAAVKDGWYCTGDIGLVDDEGFVGLTDRLSRLSKLGGEMVPHVAVEEALLKAGGLAESVLAVTGVADERKGEKLVVLYTPDCGDVTVLASALDATDLPNLWKPARNAYFAVDAIPLLGTGKVDLAGVKKLARELTGTE